MERTGFQDIRDGGACKELRMSTVDVHCIQEVRWRGQGSRISGMEGNTDKLWCCGNGSYVGI